MDVNDFTSTNTASGMSDGEETFQMWDESMFETKAFTNFDNAAQAYTTQDTETPTHHQLTGKIRRSAERTNESNGRDGYLGRRRRRTNQRSYSATPSDDLSVNGMLGATNNQMRETNSEAYQSNSDMFRDILIEAQSIIGIHHVEDDSTKQRNFSAAWSSVSSSGISPLRLQSSNTSMMAPSPDSGYTCIGSSPLNYRQYCPDGSSGFGSEFDMLDLGTPLSEKILTVSPKAKQTHHTTQKLRKFLQINYVSIKDELDSEELADTLYSNNLIGKLDREKITELKFRDSRSDKLIKSIVRTSCKRKYEKSDANFVRMVIDSFTEANYGYIFKAFEDFTEPSNPEELPIDRTWKKKLSYFFVNKGDEINPIEVIDQLLEKEVLTFDEHQSILDASTKRNKIQNLEEMLQIKCRRDFDNFCNIMRKEYPEKSKMLFEEGICEKMDTTSEQCVVPNLEVKVLKEITLDEGETEVKLTLEGAEGAERELEQMIVDQHSPKPSETLTEMVTEDIHCGLNISFSCIKVTLECMSERSRMLLLEKCKTSPQFLERWIRELIDADRMIMLKQKNIKEVKFRVQVGWPEIVLSKQDLARNYGYLKDKLDPNDHSKILEGIVGAQEVMQFISSEEAREARCKEFLLYMVTNEHAPMAKLSAELKGTKLMENMKHSKFGRSCTCKLTKKLIVENFSLVEKHVMKIEEIIDIFANFPGFDEDVKLQFKAVKTEKNTSRSEKFLRKILGMADDGYQVCLFQAALIKTHQEKLLKQIISSTSKKGGDSITKEDVSRNLSFLQQELEPMRFIPMLSEKNDTTLLCERILEADTRRNRCKLFLEYLQCGNTGTLENFTNELHRLKLTNIIAYLLSSRHQGHAENIITKEDISRNTCFLEDVLDPMELRYILIDNERDKSRTALDRVLSTTKRRRCKVFLDEMVTSEEKVFSKFTTYLEKERSDIVKFLVNSREEKDLTMRSAMESVLDAYSLIISDVDPTRLRTMFLEREVITCTDFNRICSNPARHGRAVALMEEVLKGPVSRAQCLIEAIESAGYESLIKEIDKTQVSLKNCPRLYRFDLGKDECVVFEGVVNLTFEENGRDKLDSDSLQPSNKIVTDCSVANSPLADSGCELSVVHTPGSNKPWKYLQPCSSGYTSGSDYGGQRTPGPFSPRPGSKGKKAVVPFSPVHVKCFLQKNFVLLKEEVDPSGIADILNTEGIISNTEVEKMKEEKFRVGKCDMLLKFISKSTLKNDLHIPRKVLNSFEKEGYGHFFKEFETEFEKKQASEQASLKKEEIKRRLYVNSLSLEDEVDPLLIIDDLVAEEVLSLDEHEEVKNTCLKQQRVQCLIRHILRKSDKDSLTFCNVLERHYQPQTELLKRGTSGPTLRGHRKISFVDIAVLGKPVETCGFVEKVLWEPFETCGFVEKEFDGKTEVVLKFVGDGKKEEQMIIDDNSINVNTCLQEEAMEIGFEISCIQSPDIGITLTSMSRYSQMDFLKRWRKSPLFLKKLFQHLITQTVMSHLREKRIDRMLFQLKLCLPSLEQRNCSCQLTKEVIVQHYSFLENKLSSVDKIISTFGDFDGFSEENRFMFSSLLYGETPDNRTGAFLRKLLDLPDTGIHLCLFERELRKTNPHLLEKVKQLQRPHTVLEANITASDLRRNMNFLTNELEPRYFREMLTGLEGKESIEEKVMSTEPRRERCTELLKFIIQKKNVAVNSFVNELKRNNKCHVLEVLTASRNEVSSYLKEAVVCNYRRIVDEIEPRIFGRMNFNSCMEEKYDIICKKPTRRERAELFMRYLFKSCESPWRMFIDTLEQTGYRHLLELINKDIDYMDCPRLYQSLLGTHNTVDIKGELQLDFKQGNVKESGLQVILHRMIYDNDSSEEEDRENGKKRAVHDQDSGSSEAEVKRQRTREWVQYQQCDDK